MNFRYSRQFTQGFAQGM